MATASISDRDLECPVCQELFRTPKMLPCGHTLCLDPCLERIAKNSPTFRCPECREQHNVPDGGVKKFPNNIFAIRLLSSATQTLEKTGAAVCLACGTEQVLNKCFHCGVLVCEVCRVSHTEDLRQTTATVLTQLINISDTCNLDDLQDKAKVILSENVKTMHDTVDTAFEYLHARIEERKAFMKGEIQQYSNDELHVIEQKTDVLALLLVENTKFSRNNNTTSTTPSKLLCVHDESQKLIQATIKCIDEVTNLTELFLKVTDDDVLRSIRNFGQITKIPADEKFEEAADEKVDAPPKEPLQKPFAGRRSATLREREIGKVKKCIGKQGTEPGMFNKPTAVAVSPVTGNIVVADSGNKRIQIIKCAGNDVVCANLGDDTGFLSDIVISENGHIFVAEWAKQVHVLSEDGHHIKVLKVTQVQSIAVDSVERLHVCHGTCNVNVYNWNGTIVCSYGDRSHRKAEYQMITLDQTDDSIYVLRQSEGKFYDVHIFNRELHFVRSVCLDNLGIDAIGRNGFLLVQDVFLFADRSGGRIKMLDKNFRLVKCFGEKGQGMGQLYKPRGLALTLTGDVVVVGANNYLQFF